MRTLTADQMTLLIEIARGNSIALLLPRRAGGDMEMIVVATCPSDPNERLAQALEDGRGEIVQGRRQRVASGDLSAPLCNEEQPGWLGRVCARSLDHSGDHGTVGGLRWPRVTTSVTVKSSKDLLVEP